MDIEKIIKHFDTNGTGLARILGVKKAAISLWRKTGKIPPRRHWQIEVLTDGKFRAKR